MPSWGFCMFYLVFSRQVAQVTVQGHEACLYLLRDTSPEITIQGPSSCPVFHMQLISQLVMKGNLFWHFLHLIWTTLDYA